VVASINGVQQPKHALYHEIGRLHHDCETYPGELHANVDGLSRAPLLSTESILDDLPADDPVRAPVPLSMLDDAVIGSLSSFMSLCTRRRAHGAEMQGQSTLSSLNTETRRPSPRGVTEPVSTPKSRFRFVHFARLPTPRAMVVHKRSRRRLTRASCLPRRTHVARCRWR
jgi:hypothetical protein